MAIIALVLYPVYLALAFGLRSWLQRRRTGATGWRGVAGHPCSIVTSALNAAGALPRCSPKPPR